MALLLNEYCTLLLSFPSTFSQPSYAKTDSEIFREKHGYDMPVASRVNGAVAWALKGFICLVALGVGWTYLSDRFSTGGSVLGGGSSTAGEMTEEQREAARQARIARFERVPSVAKSKGAYADAMAQAMGKGEEVD